jgi:hypothetical protein
MLSVSGGDGALPESPSPPPPFIPTAYETSHEIGNHIYSLGQQLDRVQEKLIEVTRVLGEQGHSSGPAKIPPFVNRSRDSALHTWISTTDMNICILGVILAIFLLFVLGKFPAIALTIAIS